MRPFLSTAEEGFETFLGSVTAPNAAALPVAIGAGTRAAEGKIPLSDVSFVVSLSWAC